MIKIVSIVLLGLLTVGCSSKNVSPASVSKDFWVAQKQERLEEAKRLTVKEDIKKTTLYKKIKIKSVEFGDVKEDGKKATVATKLHLKDDKDISEVDFLTKLSYTDKGWRINMSKTKQSLYFAIGEQVTGNLGNILKESLGDLENFKELFDDFLDKFKQTIEKN